MQEFEYCLLWATPSKTVVVKPGGQVERISNRERSQGILTGLQSEGWETVAYNSEPTVDMMYMFKRPVLTPDPPVVDRPLPEMVFLPPSGYQQINPTL